MIIPEDNIPDLDDVDDVVKENIEFISVSGLSEVFTQAFADVPRSEPKKEMIIEKKNAKRAAIRQ